MSVAMPVIEAGPTGEPASVLMSPVEAVRLNECVALLKAVDERVSVPAAFTVTAEGQVALEVYVTFRLTPLISMLLGSVPLIDHIGPAACAVTAQVRALSVPTQLVNATLVTVRVGDASASTTKDA